MLDLDETINPNGTLEYMLQIAHGEKKLFTDAVKSCDPIDGSNLIDKYRAENVKKVLAELA